MAEDIMNLLVQSYNDNAREQAQNMNSAGRTINKMSTFTSNYDTRNIPSSAKPFFEKELKEIEKINNQELKRYESLYKKELELHEYSLKFKKDLYEQESKHYKNIFNLQTGIHEQLVNYKENERNIYKEISKNGKITLQNQFELYSLKVKEQELEKQTAEYKIKKFEENVDKVKKGLTTVVNHIFRDLNELSNIYLFNNWKKGISDLQTQYETNFTEISGRLGITNGIDTHNLIGNVLNDIKSNDNYMKGLNFNNEVFPQITDAVKRGFQGEKAEEIGLTTAIDKKIMPWLDTTSDTWTNLQYNLSDNLLAQLKGQQLQLQATQEGNRILQNGVVSEITNSLAPTLLNIDANTTDVTDLSGQAQEIVMSLMNNGYSKQDAVKTANQMIDAYQNPYKALNSNNTADKLYALGGLQGGDIASAAQFAGKFLSSVSNTNWAGSGAIADLGFVTNGLTRNNKWINSQIEAGKAADSYISTNLKGTYDSKVNNLTEYVTATQKNDNEEQNKAVIKVFNDAFGNHILDIDKMILDEVINIKTWLITGFTANIVANLGNKLIDKIIGGLSKGNLFGKFYEGGQFLPKSAGGGRAPAGGQYVMSGLSKGLIGGASIAGGVTGAVIGIKDTWDNTKAITTMSLDNKEQAKNTKDYEAYKKSLEDRQFNIRGSSVAGGIIGGVAGAGGGYLAGTAAGAAVGSIIPGLGTAVGAIVGGLIGVAGGYLGAKAGEAIGEALNPFTNVLSDAAVESLNNLTILNQNWDDEVVERQNLVNSMKLASDEETKKRLLLDAGFDKNLVSMAKTSDALDNLAKSALSAAEDNSDLANAAEGLSVNLNNTAVSDVFGNLKNDFENLSSKERQQKLSEVLSLTSMDSTKRESIQKDIDGSRGFANRTTMKNVEDILARIQSASDDKSVRSIAGNYDLNYDTLNITYFNKLNDAIINKDKEAAIDAITMLKADKISGSDKSAWDTIKTNETYKKALENIGIDVKQYKLGSSYIPYDMIAQLHAGERVLTANQNKEYTKELETGNGSIIVNSIQDVVSAIQNQTKTIIDYLSTMNFNNSSGFKKMNMLPSMGNTKVTL
ncbi:MAG: hypothetical protein SPJ27_07685 [Candidatus Onthovivens sp.]|nr:hypothetical protein [Candidatus Onthovivens sp.]